VDSDSGAQIRDGIKTVASQGACPETMWPYVESSFATCPPPPCYANAKLHPAVQYARVPQDAGHLKTCLAAGFPFVFGFTVYESFESDAVAKSGIVAMPASGEASVGGHAVMAVGYDDARKDSWCGIRGAGLGSGRLFHDPYTYLSDADLADDFW